MPETIVTEYIEYQVDGRGFRGFLACDPSVAEKTPAVLVAHAWRGQDDFARSKAIRLAEMGYIGFAADVYGNGQEVSVDEAPLMMQPLFLDRAELRKRIIGAYETLLKQKNVDKSRIGAIGYCFGGLTVYELYRSGVQLRGTVSFHGVLTDELSGEPATLTPISDEIEGSLLILHGDRDPMMTSDDLASLRQELNAVGADWQIHLYGGAMHAFTNPSANDPNNGMLYHRQSDERSWQTMNNFFEEVLS